VNLIYATYHTAAIKRPTSIHQFSGPVDNSSVARSLVRNAEFAQPNVKQFFIVIACLFATTKSFDSVTFPDFHASLDFILLYARDSSTFAVFGSGAACLYAKKRLTSEATARFAHIKLSVN